jgi:uncharacterized protein (DUF885 family)
MAKLQIRHLSMAALFILGQACPRAAGIASNATANGAQAPGSATSERPPPSAAEAELAALFEQDWQARRAERPSLAAADGDRRHLGQWDDESPLGFARRHARLQGTLERLRGIDRSLLSEASQLDYDLFQRSVELDLEGYRWGVHLLAVTNLGGPQYDDSQAEMLSFDSIHDFQAWNTALEAYPTRIEQLVSSLESGIARRIVPSKAAMRQVSQSLSECLVGPEQSRFYFPYRGDRPEAIGAGDWQVLAQRAREAIAQRVLPALRRFRAFFDERYFPAGHDADGVWQLPDGEARYAYQVRLETSTRLTPTEVHELGLREVARIRAEMLATVAQTGFSGSLEEFFEFLRKDPRFYGSSAEEVLARYSDVVRRAEQALPRAFHGTIRAPLQVLPVPESWADATPGGVYRRAARDGHRPAALLVNTKHPETRPSWEAAALALHEGLPGHHLQISIEQGLRDRPRFLEEASFGAYAEGWALYAESLGDELGLMPDAYARFGKLANEMWRAIRLVVDTGMHALRWSRAEAIRYFLANCPKPEKDVIFEVDRYLALPGSALAYKLGELSIRGLRRRAREELGAQFDLAAFHDAILGDGALPLDVLERRVTAWIEAQRARP